ncbi:MAG: glycosyltransferase family 4 protein, partial [Bacteroidota bacterium]
WLYRHIDYALFVGKENRNYFEKHAVRADKLKFSPHAVDNDFFAFNEEESNQKALEWRQRLGIKNDEFVILFAGKFEEKKAPTLLIRAFLNSSNPKLKLLMTGNGILESEIKSMAASNKNVIFLNFQNQQNMPILYRMADIFILPSKGPGETWGLSVNEAMACDRPVIVSDKVGCCPDLVENGKTGYIFPSNSIESLINLMNNIQSKEVLLNMGINAREKIKSFSYQNVCNVIEAILSNKVMS